MGGKGGGKGGKGGKKKSKGKGKGKGASKGRIMAANKEAAAPGGKKRKGDSKGGDAAGGKVKGKGKGKSASLGPAGTRKERKKSAINRSKGLPPVPIKGAAPVPVITKAKKFENKKAREESFKAKKDTKFKRVRPGKKNRDPETGKGKGKGKGKSKGQSAEEKPKKKIRIRIGRMKKKKLVKSAKKGSTTTEGEPVPLVKEPPPPPTGPFCRNGHTMGHRTTNPVGYQNEACCDVCGLEKIVKKKAYFYHCSFCRFDICPHCSNNWTAELTAGRKPKHTKEQADKEEANPHKRKKDWSWAQESAPGVPGARERRDIWIPTE
ncbi:unnamed protein product, partial [Polarella glacialis]